MSKISNSILRFSCSFALCMFVFIGVQAQGERLIFSEEIAASGTEACVKVSVEGFTNVEQLAIRLVVNPANGIATFSRATNFNLPGLSAANVNLLGLILRLDWNASNPNVGETLTDGTVIVEFCYDIVGNPGASVVVEVIGDNQTIFGKTNGDDIVPAVTKGSITIPDMPLEIVESNIMPDNCFEVDNNGSVDITVSGGEEPYSFAWSNMTNDEDLTDVAGGIYVVTVTDMTPSEVVMTFEVPDMTTEPLADVGTNDLITCENEIIILGGDNTSMGVEFDYQWIAPSGVAFIDGQNSPMATIDTGGQYSFRVTNMETGCTTETFIMVTEDKDAPNLEVSMDMPLNCSGANLITAANDQGLNDLLVIWRTDDGVIFDVIDDTNIRAIAVGTYTVEMTNRDNGCISTDSVTITESILPNIELLTELTPLNCDMTSLDLEVSIEDGFTVSWTTVGGSIDGPTDMTTATISAAGMYTVETMNPLTECASILEFEVMGSTEEPIVDAGEDTSFNCANPIATLSSMTTGAESVLWTDGSGAFISTDNMIDVDRSGTYILNATNIFGCTRSDEVQVVADTMSPIANAGISFEIGCITDNIVLDGSGSEMGPNFSYMWSTSNGSLVSDFTSLAPSINSAGTYDLVVTNNETGCSSLSSIEVSLQADLLLANAGADFSVCENMAALSGNTQEMITGVWTTTSSASIDNPTTSDVMISNLGEGPNLFIWTLSTADCADYSRDTINVIFESTPTANDDNRSIPLTESIISFSVLDNDNTANNDGVVVEFTANNPNFMDLGDGTFSYTFASDSTSTFTFSYILCSEVCPDLCDDATVTVERQEPALEPVDLDALPNVITPNGDGLNDALIFDIMLTNPQDFPNPELTVFNRWGDVVYRQQPYDNDWRGTNQTGGELPEGTYYFINRLTLANTNVLSGDITIIRD